MPISSTIERVRRQTSRNNITDENHETIIFIWFDPGEQSNINLVGPLRVINDSVQVFTDSSSCFDTIRSSKEKIFFICSISNNELITTVHDFPAVEAIFILDANVDSIKGDFPKLFGIFTQQEELFRTLKEVFDTFEQIQLEEFAFEQDKIFLWSQLWKEELISRKVSANKNGFIEMARHYYRDNTKIIELIAELEKSYRSGEAISCKTQLNVCRFLFTDAARFFQQQPKRKVGDQVYRGMKISSELLDRFEAQIGQLVCTSGFFPCTKSRTNALTSASLPAYRSDLIPVFFKIDCDASSLFTEITSKNSPPFIVFDACMAFRIVYVNRGQMSIVKMKTAAEAGKKIALGYLETHKDEKIQSILDELLKPPPPPPRIPTPPSVQIQVFTEPVITVEETQAQNYVEKGDIDLAILAYRRIQPATARILNTIGRLCADRKGDYEYALQCHKQALKMQEKSGEDSSETLTNLGNVHHSRNEYDLALFYHRKALELRQAIPTTESAAIASSLIGLARAHLARHEHSEAIANAERALALQEALVPPNETSVAMTLALLGNIYEDFGDSTHALGLCTKALILFERSLPANSPILAELLHNLGTIQSRFETLADAQDSLERSVKIYKKLLPRGHQERVSAENELRRIVQLRQKNKENSVQQEYLNGDTFC